MIHLEIQGHIVPQWKALSGGKYEPRGIIYVSTLNVCQNVLNSANSLHATHKVAPNTIVLLSEWGLLLPTKYI